LKSLAKSHYLAVAEIADTEESALKGWQFPFVKNTLSKHGKMRKWNRDFSPVRRSESL